MFGKAKTRPAAADGGARQVRNRQILLFCVLAAVCLFALSAWFAGSGGENQAPAARVAAEIASVDAAEDSWTRRSEARLGALETNLRELGQGSRELEAENQRLREEMRGNAEEAREVIDRLSAALISSENAREAFSAEAIAPDPFSSAGGSFASSGPGGAVAPIPSASNSLIRRYALDAPAFRVQEGEASKPLSVWLPAGSHAEAVVIAGVDASAGVVAQGDPRPVLLRITGSAWTAAEEGLAQSVDLDGCTLTGAAFGELSSEKIYVRLQTLTCSGQRPGTVIETAVAGFVAGAGKAGVRGPVVSREGALVQQAFLAGLVSGAGQGLSSAYTPQAFVTGSNSAAVANTSLEDIGRAGLGSGAGSAGRRVSDYLIRRAEQYQPVIQLQAGTAVTVVFLEGTRLDGRPESTITENENNE